MIWINIIFFIINSQKKDAIKINENCYDSWKKVHRYSTKFSNFQSFNKRMQEIDYWDPD